MKKLFIGIMSLLYIFSSSVFGACEISKIKNGEVCASSSNSSLTIPSPDSVNPSKFNINQLNNNSHSQMNNSTKKIFTQESNVLSTPKQNSVPQSTRCIFGVCSPKKPANQRF